MIGGRLPVRLTGIGAGQFAQLSRQAGLLVLALLLPRITTDTTLIGWWEQWQFLAYVLGFGWLGAAGQALLTRYRRLPAARAEQLTRLALLTVTGFSAVVLLLAYVAAPWVLPAVIGSGTLVGYGAILLYLLGFWPAALFEQLLLARGELKRLLFFTAFSNLAVPLLFGLLLYAYPGRWTAVWFMVGTSGLRLLYVGWYGWQRGRPPGSRPLRLLKFWLRPFPALLAYGLLAAASVAVDPWLVGQWSGGDEDVFAIFRYGARELPLVGGLLLGIGQAVLPTLTSDRAVGLEELRRASRRAMHLLFPLSIFLLLTSTRWWPVLFTETFLPSLPLFQVFLLVLISRPVFSLTVLVAERENRVLPVFGLLDLVVNLGLSYLLLHRCGLIGVAWGTVAAFTLEKSALALYLWRVRGIAPAAYLDIWWWGGYCAVLVGAFWWVF